MWEVFNPVDGKPVFMCESELIARIVCWWYGPHYDYGLIGEGWVSEIKLYEP